MQVKEIEIPHGRSDRFRLYPIGDEHTGTLYCNEKALKEKVQEIKNDKNAMWVAMEFGKALQERADLRVELKALKEK